MINHPEIVLVGNTNAVLPEVHWSQIIPSGVGCFLFVADDRRNRLKPRVWCRDFYQDICLNNNTKLAQVQFVYFLKVRSRQFADAVNYSELIANFTNGYCVQNSGNTLKHLGVATTMW